MSRPTELIHETTGRSPGVSETIESWLPVSVDAIGPDLEAVEAILRSELTSDVDSVSEMLQHPVFWRGKRLRPMLLLLCGHATGGINTDHHLIAAVIEIIHAATLVHDDVLDDAETRRHATSLNRRVGNQLSVLLGDYLFSHAFYLASTQKSTFVCCKIGEATNAMCVGEIMQIQAQGNVNLSEAEYLQIIDGKTAKLCECACQLGAHLNQVGAEAESEIAEMGRLYGRAFQVIDDILDLQGNEATVGKSLGSDVRQLKMTLPVIHALQVAPEGTRAEWQNKLQENTFSTPQLVQFVEAHHGFQYAADYAKCQVARSQAAIRNLLPPDAAGTLSSLGDLILTRNR